MFRFKEFYLVSLNLLRGLYLKNLSFLKFFRIFTEIKKIGKEKKDQKK